jgi:acyl carrier protein
MEHVMSGSYAQVVVVRADWRKYMRQFPVERKLSLISRLVSEDWIQTQAGTPMPMQERTLVPQFDQVSPAEGRKLLQAYVRDVIIQVLGLEPSFFIDPKQGWRDIGMDSLMSLELRNRLQTGIGKPLPSTLAYDFPTMSSLVDYLAEEVLAQKPVQDIQISQEADNWARNVAQLDGLSDEEAEALLLEELSQGNGGDPDESRG